MIDHLTVPVPVPAGLSQRQASNTGTVANEGYGAQGVRRSGDVLPYLRHDQSSWLDTVANTLAGICQGMSARHNGLHMVIRYDHHMLSWSSLSFNFAGHSWHDLRKFHELVENCKHHIARLHA